ncbi:serine hydrolase, partial [Undibacterium sp.]|uniref:serine hydrolase domain-containing protein n=1 Tax=Undibacterium sp. TaxID=1914977 RepID=UPI002D06DDD0
MTRAFAALFSAAIGLGLAAAFAAGPVAAQAAGKPMLQLDRQLQAIVADQSKPLASLSALAIRDGKIVYQQSFGYRTIDPAGGGNSLPADNHTLYRVASVSKLVTGIGVLHLVDQGKLDLDADIGNYLGFAVRNPHFPDVAITTRMLLTHTSSLRDEGGYSFPADVSLRSVLLPAGPHYGKGLQWADTSGDSERAPGKYFEYCNLNWGVLGSIIEAVSGQRFDRYMRQAV